MGLAAKPWAARVPVGWLLVAAWWLDLLAVILGYAGVEGGPPKGAPWSHGLLMSLCWSGLAAAAITRFYRSARAGVVVGLVVFSHWLLDLISHPIPFSSFSFRTWQWSYGHPLPSDLPLLFRGSPVVGLGLYNHISAVQATVLELAMFAAGGVVYGRFVVRERRRRVEAVGAER